MEVGNHGGHGATPSMKSTYSFSALRQLYRLPADSIFSSRCGAISGRLRFGVSLSRRDPVDRIASVQKIDDRLGVFSGSRAASAACCAFLLSVRGVQPAHGTGSRTIAILSAFCDFSRLCRAENFRLDLAAERPAFGQVRKRRLRSCRAPTLFRLAPCARTRAVARGASPRSERCRRGSCAGSATPKVKRVDPKTLTRIRFLRKKNRQKSTPPEFRE